jgi:hypothetical protein
LRCWIGVQRAGSIRVMGRADCKKDRNLWSIHAYYRCEGAESRQDRILLWNLREQSESKILSAHTRRQRQLAAQTSRWEQLVKAIGCILNPAREGQPRTGGDLYRDRADSEQQKELEFYLDVITEEHIARSMDPAAARDAAHRKLGNATLI